MYLKDIKIDMLPNFPGFCFSSFMKCVSSCQSFYLQGQVASFCRFSINSTINSPKIENFTKELESTVVCHASELEMLQNLRTEQFSLHHEQFSNSFLSDQCSGLLRVFLIIVALLYHRGHLYRFDDFLTAWSEKLRAKDPTSMTVRLQKDVDKYKVESISI